MRPARNGALAILSILAMAGCGQEDVDRGVTIIPHQESPPEAALVKEKLGSPTKPTPPLSLAEPAPMPAELDGENLSQIEDADELQGRAFGAMGENDYPSAAALQYWYVRKSGEGQYNLACFLARIGRVDDAFYWLQSAALEEGVDVEHAGRDQDLASLRADGRWIQLDQFLRDCERYFAASPLSKTVLVLPANYQRGVPIPAVVWLHGLGSRPDDFVDEDCQDYADSLQTAFIGVSGTRGLGPKRFEWSEDFSLDSQRVERALAELSDRVTLKPGFIIAMGFSQGAQMSLQLAAHFPERYAGAIVLSPGSNNDPTYQESLPSLVQSGFVLSCGANEHPGNVWQTSHGAEWVEKAGAKVILKLNEGESKHVFPSDFRQQFPGWVRFILETRANQGT